MSYARVPGARSLGEGYFDSLITTDPSKNAFVNSLQQQAQATADQSKADAIAFANGKKTPSDSELANMAATRANQELGDATLAMQQIADPTAYVNQREQYWYNLYKHPNAGGGAVPKASTTGARGGAPAGQWKTMSTSDQQASLANARAAIKRNPGSRQAVLQRLQAAGAPTQGL